MKLLVDGMPLRAGGGVQVAIALVKNLEAANVDFLAVLPEQLRSMLPDFLEQSLGRRLRFLPKKTPADIVAAGLRLRRIERSVRPNVCFTVFGPAYFKARSTHLVGFALPHLIYPRDGGGLRPGIENSVLDRIRTVLFARADHLVVETETARKRLVDLLNFDEGRITVVGNSVNPILAAHPATPIAQSSNPRVLVPSAYYRHKNLEFIPCVAAALRNDSGPAAEFQLTLSQQSPAWLKIAEKAAALGVGGMVSTLGNLSLTSLAEAYQSAQAVFLPTLREVSTAVYPEAFHFERPLVTSDLDFARESCGDAALYIPPHDARHAAGALGELLSNPREAAALIRRGQSQLKRAYPSPEEKFAAQMSLLASLAAQRLG